MDREALIHFIGGAAGGTAGCLFLLLFFNFIFLLQFHKRNFE